jgi:type II secretory pathway component GspD/PulD (secretin)
MRFLLATVVICGLCSLASSTAAAQTSQPDYGRLVHPEMAEDLGLSDEQRANIQKLLQDIAEVKAAAPEDQQQQVAALEGQIRELLSAEQLQQWQDMGRDTGQLQFKFQQQSWADVLRWFAEQEGLTLVMNQVPPGSFTYNDNRTYTAAEAIDLLNSVLLTRGYTLVRRERMLTVLQLSDSIPIELIPRVTLEELPARGRFELVSVLFPLGKRPVDAVLNEVQPYLGSYGRVVPLPQSRQLLVVETAGKMETINVLINSVPEPKQPPRPKPPEKPPKPVFATYALGDLDPTATLETIQSLVGSERITVDAKTRLLSAFVVPGEQTAIQTYIEAMRQGAGTAPETSSRAYEFTSGTGEQLREQILAIAPQAKVTVDTTASRLYVTAAQPQQEAIAEALREMGISAADMVAEVKAYRVVPGQAASLSTAMQSMLPEATVVGNDALGTVVVRGSAADVTVADQVIERWSGGDLPENMTVHTFPLPREADATWLERLQSVAPRAEMWLADDGRSLLMLGTKVQQQRLEQLMPQFVETLPEAESKVLQTRELAGEQLERWRQLENTITAQWPDVTTVLREGATGEPAELWVWAEPEAQSEITTLLDQLQQPTAEVKPRWPQRYSLDGRPRELVVDLLERNYEGIEIASGGDGDQLTVWATLETHEQIAQTMSELAGRLPAAPRRQLRSYQVRGMTGTQLQSLVSPLATEAEVAPTLTIDPQDRRLIVLATAELHESIAALVDEVGAPLPADEELIFLAYTLEHANAEDVKSLLETSLDGATIVADPGGRQLVATATLAQHARIKSLVQELDRPVAASRRTEVRAYDVRQLAPTAVLSSLQSMWPRMTLEADAEAKKIIATGTAADHAGLAKTIERLNASPEGQPLTVETYKVEAGDLTTLPNVLLQLAPSALISADPANRVLVVWANADQHERIAAAVEQLQQSAERRDEVGVFRLRPEQTADVRRLLASLFPQALVNADATSGQITVLAPADQQSRIKEVIDKAVRAAEEDWLPQPRSYEVPPRVGEVLTRMLTSNVPRASVLRGSAGDEQPWMVMATAEDHQRIAELITQLKDQIPETRQRQVRVYSLDKVDPQTFSSMLSERVPGAESLSGGGSGQLLILATDEEHVRVEEIFEELRGAYEAVPERMLRVYRVREDLVPQATAGLANVLPRATLLPAGTDPQRLSVLATAAEHAEWESWLADLDERVPEPEVTESRVFPLRRGTATSVANAIAAMDGEISVTAEAAGNRVIVSAKPEQLERVAAVIEQIESEATEGRTTESYALEEGSASTLQVALQASFPEATIAADAANNVLIVSADPEDQQTIASVIDQQNAAVRKDHTTRSYHLEEGNAAALRLALQASFPRATVTSDPTNNVLIVSADQTDQSAIAAIVEEQNNAPGVGEQLEAYVLKNADPETVAEAVEDAFGRRSGVGVSFDRDSATVFVVGLAKQQRIAAELVEKLDQPATGARERQLKTFSLAGVDGSEVAESVESLFEDARPAVDVRYDFFNEQLVVIATAEQMELLEQTLAQFETPERELEILALTENDPDAVRDAIDALFEDIPVNELPSVTVDEDRQQLLVRATPEQHAEIKKLLQRLGEEVAAVAGPTGVGSMRSRGGGSGRMRTIPVGRDAERLLRRIQRVWPGLRGNPIQVIEPAIPGRPPSPSVLDDAAAPAEGQRATAGVPAAAKAAGPLTLVSESKASADTAGSSAPQPPADSAAADTAEPAANDTAADPQGAPAGRPNAATDSSGEEPVIIVPGNGRWTVVSQDDEALDLIEQLISVAVSPPMIPVTTSGNTSVYVLQYADADDLADLLDDLFGPRRRRGNRNAIDQRNATQIVADRRINGLVIQGSRAERGTIEDLLAVLDSPEFIDALRTASPEIVPVVHTDAERIRELLTTVYAEQLSSDGGRPEIEIPAGVSDEVASLLQQINAETSGPLLTLSVDEITNSIVMRAPPELAREVRTFVESVDQRAASSPARRLRIIQLRGGNAESIGDLLQTLRNER